jgi:thiamine pyrophosphate-dependent acetolactate synthase large subunit-like protein
MNELTVDGKVICENITISIRMPRAFGFRMWLTAKLLAAMIWVSPVKIGASIDDDEA